MYVYLFNQPEFIPAHCKEPSAYMRTEEKSFLVKIQRILFSKFKKLQKYTKNKKYKIINVQGWGKKQIIKLFVNAKHCFYDT